MKHVRYQSSSPDEMALVEAAHDFGYVFVRRVSSRLYVLIDGVLRCFKVLVTNPFTSERKRMSVLVQEVDIDETEAREWWQEQELDVPYRSSVESLEGSPAVNTANKGPAVLYVKGSAASMRQLLDGADDDLAFSVDLYGREFGRRGLRTMVIARRVLSPSESETIVQEFKRASNALVDRRQVMLDLANQWEKSLQYLGITAVEDCICEGAPAAVRTLRNAGVRLWMVTGDGAETATNIALSCDIIEPGTRKHVLSGGYDIFCRLCDLYKKIKIDPADRCIGKGKSIHIPDFALLIDGAAFSAITEAAHVNLFEGADDLPLDLMGPDHLPIASEFALEASQKAVDRCQELFVCIAIHARSVLAVDMSPSQKARLEELFCC